MKILNTLLFLSLSICNIKAQSCLSASDRSDIKGNFVTDAHKENLKGKVKSISEYNYDPIVKDGEIVSLEGYKKNVGKKIIFDQNGNIPEYHSYCDTLDKNKICKTNKYKLVYDENRNLIELYTYEPDGELDSYSKYSYDKLGRVALRENYRSNNTLSTSFKYKYDKKTGYLSSYLKKDNYNYTYTFKSSNNENGGITIDRYYGSNKEYTYTFNSKGLLLQEYKHRTSSGNIRTANYKYDEKGNCISQENTDLTYKSGNYTYKYTYVYDDMGNWIEKTVYKNDEPQRVLKRIIEYEN